MLYMPIIGDHIKVNLQDIYSMEEKLNRKRIDFYKLLEVALLLKDVETTVHCESLSQREILKFELIDGHHRCRALLELNVQEAFIEYNGATFYRANENFILLKDVPVLNEQEYEEWHRKTYGSLQSGLA